MNVCLYTCVHFFNYFKGLKKIMKNIFKSTLVTGLAFLNFGCIESQNLRGYEHSYDEKSFSNKKNMSQVLIYRPEKKINEKNESIDSGSIIISSDGHVLGGLNENQYTPVQLCAGDNELVFEYLGDYKDVKKVNVVTYEDEVTYLMASVLDGKIVIKNNTEREAIKSLEGIEYQSFLLNRLNDSCVLKEPEIKLENFDLSTDVLFEFDKSDLNGLIAKDELDEIIRNIYSHDYSVKNVVVSGYSDRLGGEIYNQKLSEERALSIANYLKRKGINVPFKIIGYGESKTLLDTVCSDDLDKQEIIECLQPDRKVSIEIWGTY